MSLPRTPSPVKLISSLFSPERSCIDSLLDELSFFYGPIDRISEELLFDRTKYYAREMGWPLYRRFISFRDLIFPEQIVEIKLQTNKLEQQNLFNGNRTINIDPGYLCPERLVLATGKNYVHRIYLSKGIYADLTLVFKRGSYRALEWTYPDYSSHGIIRFFNELRKRYMEQLREM